MQNLIGLMSLMFSAEPGTGVVWTKNWKMGEGEGHVSSWADLHWRGQRTECLVWTRLMIQSPRCKKFDSQTGSYRLTH